MEHLHVASLLQTAQGLVTVGCGCRGSICESAAQYTHTHTHVFATDFLSHFSSFSPFRVTRFDTPLHSLSLTHTSLSHTHSPADTLGLHTAPVCSTAAVPAAPPAVT